MVRTGVKKVTEPQEVDVSSPAPATLPFDFMKQMTHLKNRKICDHLVKVIAANISVSTSSVRITKINADFRKRANNGAWILEEEELTLDDVRSAAQKVFSSNKRAFNTNQKDHLKKASGLHAVKNRWKQRTKVSVPSHKIINANSSCAQKSEFCATGLTEIFVLQSSVWFGSLLNVEPNASTSLGSRPGCRTKRSVHVQMHSNAFYLMQNLCIGSMSTKIRLFYDIPLLQMLQDIISTSSLQDLQGFERRFP